MLNSNFKVLKFLTWTISMNLQLPESWDVVKEGNDANWYDIGSSRPPEI